MSERKEIMAIHPDGRQEPLRNLLTPGTALFDLLCGEPLDREGPQRGRSGWLYVGERYRGSRVKRVKIGFTTNLGLRFQGLRAESRPDFFRILCVFAGDEAGENELLAQFAELREFGEWFRPDARLRDFVKDRIANGAVRPRSLKHMYELTRGSRV